MTTGSTRGASLVELLVALLLATLMIGLAGRTLLHATHTARRAVARDDGVTARRVARLALRSELAALGPGHVRSSGGDSIRIRAVRGGGRVCGFVSDSTVVVDLVAHRRPDPAKDSIEMIGPLGRVDVVRLRATGPAIGACGSRVDGEATRMITDGVLSPEAVFVRFFESGSYHVGTGALRYRIGRGGRQPLSPEVLAPSSGLSFDGRLLRVTLMTESGDSVPDYLTVRW